MSETLTMEGRTWTETRDAALRKYHAAGLSATEIGDRMELTRNQVIGRIHRLGIQKGGQRRTAPAQRRKRVLAPKTPLPPTVKEKPLPPMGPPAMPVVELPPEPAPLEGSLSLTLLDLEPHQCKFPVTSSLPHLFCGAERVEGRPYCSHHVAIASIRGSNARPVGLPRSLIGRAA
jgi:GcrA cell cycle regulator